VIENRAREGHRDARGWLGCFHYTNDAQQGGAELMSVLAKALRRKSISA